MPVDDEGAFIDIDTPDDYERWIGRRDPASIDRISTREPTM